MMTEIPKKWNRVISLLHSACWGVALQGLHFFPAYPPLRGGLTSFRAYGAGASRIRDTTRLKTGWALLTCLCATPQLSSQPEPRFAAELEEAWVFCKLHKLLRSVPMFQTQVRGRMSTEPNGLY